MKALERKEDEAMEEEKKRKKKGSSPDNPSKLKKTNSVNIPDAVLDDSQLPLSPATSEAELESPGGCDGSHSKEEKILYHVTPEGKFQWVYFLLL